MTASRIRIAADTPHPTNTPVIEFSSPIGLSLQSVGSTFHEESWPSHLILSIKGNRLVEHALTVRFYFCGGGHGLFSSAFWSVRPRQVATTMVSNSCKLSSSLSGPAR